MCLSSLLSVFGWKSEVPKSLTQYGHTILSTVSKKEEEKQTISNNYNNKNNHNNHNNYKILQFLFECWRSCCYPKSVLAFSSEDVYAMSVFLANNFKPGPFFLLAVEHAHMQCQVVVTWVTSTVVGAALYCGKEVIVLGIDQ